MLRFTPDSAHRFADRVIALRDGRIVGRIDSVPLMPRRFA
jgi:ABC-type phosphate/phosphonate transport system ATPase subunit